MINSHTLYQLSYDGIIDRNGRELFHWHKLDFEKVIHAFRSNGTSEIRTHAPFYRPDGFQDRSLKPDLSIVPE